jgi:hypothetical protein
MTTCARKATTSAEVVVFCFSGGYDRIWEKGKTEPVGAEGGFEIQRKGSGSFMRKLLLCFAE